MDDASIKKFPGRRMEVQKNRNYDIFSKWFDKNKNPLKSDFVKSVILSIFDKDFPQADFWFGGGSIYPVDGVDADGNYIIGYISMYRFTHPTDQPNAFNVDTTALTPELYPILNFVVISVRKMTFEERRGVGIQPQPDKAELHQFFFDYYDRVFSEGDWAPPTIAIGYMIEALLSWPGVTFRHIGQDTTNDVHVIAVSKDEYIYSLEVDIKALKTEYDEFITRFRAIHPTA
jgi:hypothetical protein